MDNFITFKEIIMKSLKWYTIATCIWIFVFPITGITGWAFMISGSLAIVASIVKFAESAKAYAAKTGEFAGKVITYVTSVGEIKKNADTLNSLVNPSSTVR